MRAGKRRTERLRYWLWYRLIKVPKVCPAGSHSRVVWGIKDAEWRIDWACRSDCEANGACWCGKLNKETADAQ